MSNKNHHREDLPYPAPDELEAQPGNPVRGGKETYRGNAKRPAPPAPAQPNPVPGHILPEPHNLHEDGNPKLPGA